MPRLSTFTLRSTGLCPPPGQRAALRVPGGSSSSQAASGTTATCTGRTSPRPRRASAASTGWPCKAAASRPPSPVSVRPGGGGRGWRARPLTSLLSASGPGNHNYCRNPDRDPRGPWCYISSESGVPEKRPCEDVRCPGNHPGPRGGDASPGRLAAAVPPAVHVRPLDARPAPFRPRAVRLVRAISRPRSPKPIGRRGIRSELILREHL